MSFLPRPLAPLGLVFAFAVVGALAAIEGCSSDSTTGGAADDAGVAADGPGSKTDGAADDDGSASDGGTDAPTDAKTDGGNAGKGETCIGFAKGSPCGAGGLPDYGYVCFNGSPPGIAGCTLASSSAFGETYCCTENKCVAQPDQDKTCTGGKPPHRYQCPPEGDAGATVAPASGCVSAGGGGGLEAFFCCP